MDTLDVVVPVCQGMGIVRRCIESVLSEAQRTRFELVVVDDASDEADLLRWLREQRDHGRLTLLEQPSRGGFASAVNRALSLHPERDVVVLHGETEVAGDWLDRLVKHAGKASDIATIVPFADSGGVAGYPRATGGNVVPGEHTLASLDSLFKRANAGISVPLNSTGGPCVYLKRAFLNAVGAWEGDPSASSARVEDRFSLRAGELGFRHVLAADVFVQHQGDAESIEASPAENPSRAFRRRVDLLRLAESPRHLLLFIGHAWGGGIRRHMVELAKMIGERCNVLILEPAAKDAVRVFWCRPGEDFSAFFRLPEEMDALTSMLRALGLARIHFHHVHGLPRSVLELPGAVGVPYDCTLHDYYAICPQYHLVTLEGRYCGEPDAAGCAACIAQRPHQWDLDIRGWRGSFEQLLRGAERVIAPSHDVARRIARYFPELSTTVSAHPETHQPRVERMVRVVTLGNLSPEKGLRVVAACVEDARQRRLPLAFRVLGPTTESVAGWPNTTLSIHGQYPDEELPRLLAAEGPDVIWFPAQVPETYSYTLSAAIASGVPIVASNLGALPERLANCPHAIIVPWDATPETWNEALRSAATHESADTAQAVLAKLATS